MGVPPACHVPHPAILVKRGHPAHCVSLVYISASYMLTVGEVKGCCCRWKSVVVIVGVDCGVECGVSGTCM